jgi:hypothetical protein
MKSNYRPKPEFLWNEQKQALENVTYKKSLYNSLMPYKHIKSVSKDLPYKDNQQKD